MIADLGAVRHRDDDPVARADAELGEAGRRSAGALEQLARAVPAALEQQRRVVAAPLERRFGQPGKIVGADR